MITQHLVGIEARNGIRRAEYGRPSGSCAGTSHRRTRRRRSHRACPGCGRQFPRGDLALGENVLVCEGRVDLSARISKPRADSLVVKQARVEAGNCSREVKALNSAPSASNAVEMSSALRRRAPSHYAHEMGADPRTRRGTTRTRNRAPRSVAPHILGNDRYALSKYGFSRKT